MSTPMVCPGFAAAAAAQREKVAAALRRSGHYAAGQRALRTDSDRVANTMRCVVASTQRWSGGIA